MNVTHGCRSGGTAGRKGGHLETTQRSTHPKTGQPYVYVPPPNSVETHRTKVDRIKGRNRQIPSTSLLSPTPPESTAERRRRGSDQRRQKSKQHHASTEPGGTTRNIPPNTAGYTCLSSVRGTSAEPAHMQDHRFSDFQVLGPMDSLKNYWHPQGAVFCFFKIYLF